MARPFILESFSDVLFVVDNHDAGDKLTDEQRLEVLKYCQQLFTAEERFLDELIEVGDSLIDPENPSHVSFEWVKKYLETRRDKQGTKTH